MRRVVLFLLFAALAAASCTTEESPTGPFLQDLEGVTPSFGTVAYDCSAQSEIPTAECEALVALYNSTNGPGWTTSTGWLSTNPPCTWHGVTCLNGSVLYIDPVRNKLAGPIPPELGDLANLKMLNLAHNQLTGPIPPELGNLANLIYLALSDNQLKGTIPVGFGSLANLKQLLLYDNKLEGKIPGGLGGLTNLETLVLNQNQLSGTIPAELGSLANLKGLYLWDNQLSGTIPAELGSMANLEVLTLQTNQLSGLVPLAVAQLGGQIQHTRIDTNCNLGSQLNEGPYMPDTQPYRDEDQDGDGLICGLGVTATPEMIIEDLVLQMESLVADGALNLGQGNSLTKQLAQGLKKADKGQYNAAINVVFTFIDHVNDLVSGGTLTTEEGRPLTDLAMILIDFWSEML